MSRVGKGEQGTNCYGLDVLFCESTDRRASGLFIKWCVYAPVEQYALGYSQSSSSRYDGFGWSETYVPDVFLITSTQFQFVAKAFGGQQDGAGAVHLNQCIVRHRGAVNDGIDLAQQVVRDGEGATKFITVDVRGAADDMAAKIVAKSIANSPLVKTAIAGEDANWGRVVMAVGKTGQHVDQEKLLISFGGQLVTDEGKVREGYDEGALTAHLQGQEIDLKVDLGVGKGKSTVWTCDLTHGYISINADYRS